MPTAPTEIVDALESVLDIFLSDIRHRERAAFVLCDNLIEMACKTKHTQHCRRSASQANTRCNFHQAMRLSGVRMSQELRERLQQRRDMRNLMQHQSASAAVDTQTCADAVKDIPEVLIKLWGQSALGNLREWQRVAIEIVKLYSSDGDARKRQEFEDAMRRERWRTGADERQPRVNEAILEPGRRGFWGYLIKQVPNQVEQILFGCTTS